MPACDTSNMASVFTLIYAHDVRTGAKFAPRSLFAAKLVGRSGDGPRFAGGPKVLPFGEMLIYYFFGSYHREKIRSSADIDASHFTTACEASIWPHTYKNGILPPGLVRAPVEAVAVRGEVPRDTGAERDLPRPSYPIPSLTMHVHDRIVNDAHDRMLIVRFAHPPPARRRALVIFCISYPICKMKKKIE